MLCLVSLASYLSQDYKQAKIYAQKAVYCYPNMSETWTILLYTLTLNDKNKKKCEMLSRFIKNHMNPSNNLNDWLTNNYC